MDWKGKKVLITGSAGFIGSHLTERLLGLGADISSFIRYNSREDLGFVQSLKDSGKINIIKGDIRELSTIREAVKDQDVVFHLAASISVHYSMINPSEVVETNVMGTLNILDACRKEDVEKIVITSSSEVYGTALYTPIDEKHPLQAQSPYAASKIGGDKIAESFFRCYKLPVAVVRPFNTFGPRQSTRAVIPSVITQVLTKDKVLVGATDTFRDFTFVTDTAEGFIKMAESPKSIGEVVNLGTGVDISINDMIKKVVELVNKDVEIVVDEKRLRPNTSEVMKLLASNEKAKKLIGWEPKVSFEDGLKKTIDWISENINLYKAKEYHV
ncbi:MAG: GDP-mannose 4,6-dehydratase [Nanoarchaeota archaeon]|nr:GDP-mannose 4,6-dehydratase [Nanoarchaeota archaeon]